MNRRVGLNGLKRQLYQPWQFVTRFGWTEAALSLLLLSTSAWSRVTTITVPTDNVLRSVLASADAGDTIQFGISGTDTVVLEKELQIGREVVILGTNLKSGNRMVIQVANPGRSPYRLIFSATEAYPPGVEPVVVRDAVLRGGNITGAYGGVIYARGNLILDNVTVTDGVVDSGQGGGIYSDGGKLVLNNCAVINNTVKISSSDRAPPISSGGGGICFNGASMEITNTTIAGNSALANSTSDSATGPADSWGGGVYFYRGYATFVNCTVVDNVAGAVTAAQGLSLSAGGGGIYTYEGNMDFDHCTIVNNICTIRCLKGEALGTQLHGAGIYSYQVSTSIANTILMNNAIVYGTDSAGEDLYVNFPNEKLRYSIVDSAANTTPQNSLVKQSAEKIFGIETPTLKDNGGPAMTIALPVSSAGIGAGIRSGTFRRYVPGGDSVLRCAYHDGSGWRSFCGDSVLPDEVIVAPVSLDQRGVIRRMPPCIGAFEYIVPDAMPEPCWPPSGAANVPLATALVWHVVEQASSYRVQVSLKADFSVLLNDTAGVTDTSLLLSGLSTGTRYYWCVSALIAGVQGKWTTTVFFTTIDTLPPATELLLPPDKSLAAPDSVRLVWKSAGPGALRYQVDVATDQAMAHLFVSDSNVTDTTLVVRGLSDGIECRWRVRTRTGAGWGSFSETRSFTCSENAVLPKGGTHYRFSVSGTATTICYSLGRLSFVNIRFYDLKGRIAGSLVNSAQDAGHYTVAVPEGLLPAGSYVRVFSAGSFSRRERIAVCR